MRFSNFTLIICVVLVGCRREHTPEATADRSVVAAVDGVKISAEDLQRELAARAGVGKQPPPSVERKLEVLESLIREAAVFAKAKAARFDETPELQAEIRRLIASRFREKNPGPKPAAPTAQEVEAIYRLNAAKYAVAPAVRGAIIFLPSPATATPEKRAEARARAEMVLAEARGTADAVAFAAVVARHSADHATRYRGGELPWLARDSKEVDAEVTDALFAVPKPGEFAPLVETPRGFYVVKLLERREAGTKPLAQVEEAIRYELSRRKAEEAERDFFATMKSGLDIQIYRENIEALELPAEKTSAPPQMPGAVAPAGGK